MDLDEFNLKLNNLHEKEEWLMSEIQSVRDERGAFYKAAVEDWFVFESVSKTWNKE